MFVVCVHVCVSVCVCVHYWLFLTGQVLKEELKLGPMLQVTNLQADSSNIVSVIRSSYNVRTSTAPCMCRVCTHSLSQYIVNCGT